VTEVVPPLEEKLVFSLATWLAASRLITTGGSPSSSLKKNRRPRDPSEDAHYRGKVKDDLAHLVKSFEEGLFLFPP